MTTRGAGLLARLLALIVLAVSGAYLLVYLYRWEWNRAIISGIFFLGAEITLAASMVLVRIRRLDDRLKHALEPRPQAPEEPPDDRKPFAWLDPTGGGFGVFVPVLMGAGFVLSALAFLIEKLASALSPADPVRRGSEVGIGPRPVPSQGLVPAPGVLPTAPEPPASRPRRSLAATLVAVVVAALLVVAAVDVLADATQDRPDPKRAGTTVIDLAVDIRGAGPTVREAAEALWAACHPVLPNGITRVDLSPTAPGRERLVLDGVVGRNGRRRFVGCLQDATLDRAGATVLDISTEPASGGPPA